MKIVRLAGLVAIAISALSLAAASAASAGLYLFTTSSPNSIGALFLALFLTTALAFGGNTINCGDGHAEGKVADVHLIGPFDITFLGCKSSSNGDVTLCAINTEGASEGVILTKTLHGLLGTTLPGLLGGVLLLPTANKKWFTLNSNACTVATTASGSVAGLLVANQLGHSVLESLITFNTNDPTLIDTLNGRVTPELELFGAAATLTAVAHLVWDSDIEIEV